MSYTGQFAFTPMKDLTANLNWIVGPEQVDPRRFGNVPRDQRTYVNSHLRYVLDFVFQYTGIKNLTLALNVDYGHEQADALPAVAQTPGRTTTRRGGAGRCTPRTTGPRSSGRRSGRSSSRTRTGRAPGSGRRRGSGRPPRRCSTRSGRGCRGGSSIGTIRPTTRCSGCATRGPTHVAGAARARPEHGHVLGQPLLLVLLSRLAPARGCSGDRRLDRRLSSRPRRRVVQSLGFPRPRSGTSLASSRAHETTTGRVLIVDDHAPSRAAVAEAVTAQGGQVVGNGSRAEDVLRLVDKHRPGRHGARGRLPDGDGVEAAREVMTVVAVPGGAGDEPHRRPRWPRGRWTPACSASWPSRSAPEELGPALDVAVSRFRELEAVRRENEQLKRKLESRKLVERAKGILMTAARPLASRRRSGGSRRPPWIRASRWRRSLRRCSSPRRWRHARASKLLDTSAANTGTPKGLPHRVGSLLSYGGRTSAQSRGNISVSVAGTPIALHRTARRDSGVGEHAPGESNRR